MTQGRGCCERGSLFPARYLLKRAHRSFGAFAGASARAPVLFPLLFHSCLMMTGWQPVETSPLAGMSQEANRHRPDAAPGEKLLHIHF